jgi:N-formylglutamate amidohydrolase
MHGVRVGIRSVRKALLNRSYWKAFHTAVSKHHELQRIEFGVFVLYPAAAKCVKMQNQPTPE